MGFNEKARIESIVNQIEDGGHKSGFQSGEKGGIQSRNFIPRFISSTWLRLAFHLPGTSFEGKFSASISISAYFQGNDCDPLPSASKFQPRNCLSPRSSFDCDDRSREFRFSRFLCEFGKKFCWHLVNAFAKTVCEGFLDSSST